MEVVAAGRTLRAETTLTWAAGAGSSCPAQSSTGAGTYNLEVHADGDLFTAQVVVPDRGCALTPVAQNSSARELSRSAL